MHPVYQLDGEELHMKDGQLLRTPDVTPDHTRQGCFEISSPVPKYLKTTGSRHELESRSNNMSRD